MPSHDGLISHGFVEVEPDLRVRYDEVGDGPRTLILLNELGDFTRLAAGRRLIAITSRGRGGSDRLEDLSRHRRARRFVAVSDSADVDYVGGRTAMSSLA